MRIAWRYKHLDKIDSVQGGENNGGSSSNTVGHYFDLSQQIDGPAIAQLDFTGFSKDHSSSLAGQENSVFSNPAYANILNDLSNKLKSTAFTTNTDPSPSGDASPKNLLRIVLKSLGSPLWWEENFSHDLCLFLITLRALVRNSLGVCCLTIPTHLFKHFVRTFLIYCINHLINFGKSFTYSLLPQDEKLIHRVRNLVDFSVELDSFAGSDKEMNPAFKEYHGLIYIRKLCAVNTLAAHSPETHDLAFKLRRKRFVIEKLHLPPELQESDQREQEDEHILSSMGCGSTSKHLLEF